MRIVLLRLRRTARSAADRGTSAVEYGLMVAAIAAVIVGVVFALGTFINANYDNTCSALSDPMGQKCTK